MHNPFGDDPIEQFLIYDTFFATDIICPWCGTEHHLDVVDGETDARYECGSCHRVFSVNWNTREACCVKP